MAKAKPAPVSATTDRLSLKEKWELADQLGLVLKNSARHKQEAGELAAKGVVVATDTLLTAQQEGEARRMLDSTLYHLGERHGHELVPACKVTIVDKRTNEKKRHYRVNEYRLFFGEYSTFILELGTTQDQLDIDPHRVLSVHHVLDDADLRATADAKELKQKVTVLMRRGRNPAEG